MIVFQSPALGKLRGDVYSTWEAWKNGGSGRYTTRPEPWGRGSRNQSALTRYGESATSPAWLPVSFFKLPPHVLGLKRGATVQGLGKPARDNSFTVVSSSLRVSSDKVGRERATGLEPATLSLGTGSRKTTGADHR